MFEEPINHVRLMKDLVEKGIRSSIQNLAVWIVTDVYQKKEDNGYISQYTCQIKHLDFKYTLDNVPMVGIGLGNMKGILKYPNVGDMVLVGFMDKQPIILGTVYDYFSQKPDGIPLIKLNELIIVQKEKGSIILMKENNDVLIRACDINGVIDNGAKIRINADGSFKLFNKTNHGIEVDINGNMIIRGVTINATQTPGTW